MKNYTEVDLYKNVRILENDKPDKKQLETAYIIYMMVGSFYRGCRVSNQIKESNLLLYYKEMRFNEQIMLEQSIGRAFTDQFSDILPVLGLMRCEVFFSHVTEFKIMFYTGLENIVATVKENGDFSFTLMKK